MFDYDIFICCIKLYNSDTYSRVALIWVNTVMLSTWFASNLLIVNDKKTQAMILGNPFQETILHIGDSVIIIFKRNHLSFEIFMILETICKNLKLWKRNEIV